MIYAVLDGGNLEASEDLQFSGFRGGVKTIYFLFDFEYLKMQIWELGGVGHFWAPPGGVFFNVFFNEFLRFLLIIIDFH